MLYIKCLSNRFLEYKLGLGYVYIYHDDHLKLLPFQLFIDSNLIVPI